MFQGLRTVIYGVNDSEKAKAWYSTVLGIQPYFDQPFYVGFDVGGFELGLNPNVTPGTTGPVAYWSVANADAAYKHLVEAGAQEHKHVQDVGDGIRRCTHGNLSYLHHSYSGFLSGDRLSPLPISTSL